MDELTDRQSEILKLIRELMEVSGYPPTRAEIAERMGFKSVNAAEQHLRALERKGAIEIAEGASRGIRLTDSRPSGRGGRLMELPVVGSTCKVAPLTTLIAVLPKLAPCARRRIPWPTEVGPV